MKTLLILAVGLIGLTNPAVSHATPDYACMENCFRQGYGRNQCVAMCDNRAAPGMLDQPGLPRNPAFDQMQQNQPQQRPLPAVTDNKCMKDCERRGYNYMLCQKQCSYSGYGN